MRAARPWTTSIFANREAGCPHPALRATLSQWERAVPKKTSHLKTGDQREVHVRFDETLNAAELIQFIM